MMKIGIKIARVVVVAVAFTVHISLSAQTVSGTVSDAETGETLIGATILDMGSGKGTVTNAHGRYTLTLKTDSAQLRISFIGYQTQVHKVDLRNGARLNVELLSSVELDEVTVTADRINISSPKVSQMSAIEVPVEQIKLVPVIFGETDVLKAIQLLPGVQSGTEGMSPPRWVLQCLQQRCHQECDALQGFVPSPLHGPDIECARYYHQQRQ